MSWQLLLPFLASHLDQSPAVWSSTLNPGGWKLALLICSYIEHTLCVAASKPEILQDGMIKYTEESPYHRAFTFSV